MNISSVIVHARPGSAETVRTLLNGMDGIEVHGVSPEGKLIVTIETDDDGGTTEAFERISKADGVLSAAMVFHQVESDPEMDISAEADRQVAP
ncbi:Chaperone NapD [Rhodocyclaceae bacterium]|nr:Chaperone NapD [Rhodocyclaceae bacterium]